MISVLKHSTEFRRRTVSAFLVKVLVLCFLFLGTLVNISAAGGVSINAQEEPLTRVALRLQKASGIRFIVSDSLREEKVSANIQGARWAETARRVMDGFNTVALADENNKLTKVFLISKKTGYVPNAGPVTTR